MLLPGLEEAMHGQPRSVVNETTGPPAETLAVVNEGANMAQGLRHAPHIYRHYDFDIIITETVQTSPWKSGTVVLDLSGEMVNYVVLNPSARGNPVQCWVGKDEAAWAIISGVANVYPLPDLEIQGTASTVLFPLPLRSNHRFAFNILPPAWPYNDKIRVGYGYLPSLTERIVYDYAKG